MVLKVGEHDVIVELIPVHAYKIEEYKVVVPISVDHNRGALGICRIGSRNIARVNLVAIVTYNNGILEDANGFKAVIPGGAGSKLRA